MAFHFPKCHDLLKITQEIEKITESRRNTNTSRNFNTTLHGTLSVNSVYAELHVRDFNNNKQCNVNVRDLLVVLVAR